MVFAGQRCSEHGHHAVAHETTYGAAVVLHGRAHALYCAIEQGVRLFRVQLLGKCGRARDVGEQHRNGLALAGMSFPGSETGSGIAGGRLARPAAIGHGGRRLGGCSWETRNRFEDRLAVTERGDPELLEVGVRQIRQDLLVDGVRGEGVGITAEPELLQPF